MKLFELFPKKSVARESLNWAFLEARPSLYKFLVEGLDEAGRLLPDHMALPDKVIAGTHELSSVPGGRDGTRMFHTHLKPHPRQVDEMVAEFARVVETYEDADLQAFYRRLVDFDLLPSLDMLRDSLSRYPLDPARVFTFAAQLALHAADRQALKFALVVLSFYQLPEVRALALLFAQHDEFTFYSLLCLENFEDRYKDDCFLVAQCVYGWGRIHAVKALLSNLGAEDDDADLQEWLLREGFHNTVSDAYLAAEVIEKGGLLAKLREEAVDQGLLNASAILIAALLDADDGITQVKDGNELVTAYLRRLKGARQTHMHQPTLLRLKTLGHSL